MTIGRMIRNPQTRQEDWRNTTVADDAAKKTQRVIDSMHYSPLPERSYTQGGAINKVSLAFDFTSAISAGCPIAYQQGGATRYGIVTHVTAKSLTFNGAPMTRGKALTMFAFGPSHATTEIRRVIPGTYGSTLGDILAVNTGEHITWEKGKARLVSFKVRHAVNDAAGNPFINIMIAGKPFSKRASSRGLQPYAGAWSTHPAESVNVAASSVAMGTTIGIHCLQVGSSGTATDLSIVMTFAMEMQSMGDTIM